MAIGDLVSVDATGFKHPDYPTVLEYLKNEYRAIYGADVYLEADSQDGQWISILALSMYETMMVASAVYNSFSPLTAQTDALSRNVKINGIARRAATFSTVDLRVVGQSGTRVLNGQAEDVLGQKWILQPDFTINGAGEVTVTARAEKIGAVKAQPNTINKIATPTRGWQSVNNLTAAVEGVPVETDAELRRRQTVSVAIPAQSPLESIIGAVASLEGVARYRGYENDSNTTDSDGIPAHSIAMVVEGGVAQEIGDTIAQKKTPGTGTHGTTSVTTTDKFGVQNVIKFFRPTAATIGVEVTATALGGYLNDYANRIKQAVVNYIEGLEIGDDVLITKLYVPANLPGDPAGATYDITQIRIKKNAGSFGTSNITLAFNEVAECTINDVVVNVT